MKQLLLLIILLQVFCSSTFGASKQKSKAVTTLIDAQWEVTPVVLEVAEYLAEENSDYLWSFIDNLNSLKTPLVELESDRARYEASLREAGFLITPAQLSVMKLALSLHIYSPKVEMYGQMASERGLTALGCPVAADIGGKLTCNAKELNKLIKSSPKSERIETFSIDHHYPGSQNNTLTVILYGELGTPEIVEFHEVLKKHAKNGIVDYVIRHYVKERPNKKVRLSGYGVELQIKSTEYKAQDDAQVKDGKSADSSEQDDEEDEIEGFNFNRLKTLYPDQKENLDRMRIHLLESSNEMAPLKVWQVQDLSLQAAERIMSSPPEEALKVLTNVAQNFPLQARSLVRTDVSPELKKEMKQNQEKFVSSLNLQPSDTALFVNGMFFDLDVVDMVSLLEVFRQELRVMEGLYKNGITEPVLSSLLAMDLSGSSSTSQEYAIDIRDSAVMWVNDIEHDKQYRRWSDSLMELLRPTFPGMLRSVRRNLYNLVVMADPSKADSMPLLKLAESFYVHTSPLRIGLVFAVSPSSTGLEDAGVALLNAFNLVAETKDAYAGLSFITDVYAAVGEGGRDVGVDDVRRQLEKSYPDVDVDEVLGEDSEYDTGRKLAHDFIERSGFRKTPQVLLNGIPLLEKQLNAEDFEEAVLQEIMNQTPMYQKAVYKGEFTDGDNALDYIMGLPNVMPRLNDRVLGQGKSTYLDMSGSASSSLDPDSFEGLSPRDQTATFLSKVIKYATVRKHNNAVAPQIITHWVVCDPQTLPGRQLLAGALEQMRSSGTIRVGLVLNPTDPDEPQPLNKLILSALESLEPNQALHYLAKVLEDEAVVGEILAGEKKPSDITVAELDLGAADDLFSTGTIADTLRLHSTYAVRTLGVSAGGRAVVTNGRVLGPLDEDERFTADDFSLLERFCMNGYGDKIVATLRKQEEEVENSDTLMQAVALLVSRPQSKSRFEIPFRSDDHSVVKLPARSGTEPAFVISVIVDPVSRGAQKIGHILSVLQEVLNCNVKIYLNCVEKNSDMPLKSFYRFVLEPELQFTADGRLSNGPIARFTNLPASPLLTQNMQVPENWLVESVTSPYDLDNIRMEDVDSVVHSEFELEYLLLEGHCFEATYGNPPRGLQITLGTETHPVVVDTIVMANLGYFQLKANPGAWLLRLRQGRSAEIYDIVNHEGSDTPANSTDIKVLISSFRSHVLKLRVAKKPDKANVDLLSEEGADTGIWNSITSTFSGKQKGDDEGDEKINIFSLASGHLYERFLRIMMLSVLKHTKTPVKFWFLKNYLSPTLKDYLPHMAEQYGFEYELVQYKWPRWLHQQTEKQRIIWGYKILFLDVLFPLDVKKIIFVDADQVVRADLKELQDLDLGGAPYGYTPFCESRTDMDGFRFWKQGYWRNHLQGRRYHISALYVVDLKRFRRIAAGDRLRGQYQALSQDPNSLSNLDQDLPNNMIHQVAIKSLPQEWLWCETWCDEASKAKAKTIDLCNNPQTKEAKLSAAVRIVAEWRDYDEEVKTLQRKIDERHTEEGVDADPEHNPHATPDAHKAHSHSEL